MYVFLLVRSQYVLKRLMATRMYWMLEPNYRDQRLERKVLVIVSHYNCKSPLFAFELPRMRSRAQSLVSAGWAGCP